MGYTVLSRAEHKLYITQKQMRLKNGTPTIISNNCIGGIICHDMGLQFRSPFVNIGIRAPEYLEILQNLPKYMETPFEERKERYDGWPTVKWGDVWMLFAHEESLEVSLKKWEQRKNRIDYDNLFVTMTDRQGCTYEHLLMFDRLPYQNKVVITHKEYSEIKSAFYLKGFEDKQEVPVMSDWKPGYWKRRWIDDFDYIRFLNGKGINK